MRYKVFFPIFVIDSRPASPSKGLSDLFKMNYDVRDLNIFIHKSVLKTYHVVYNNCIMFLNQILL